MEYNRMDLPKEEKEKEEKKIPEWFKIIFIILLLITMYFALK